MAYADSNYYTGTFNGAAVPAAQLNQRLTEASDDIDSLTFNRIGGDSGLLSLSPFQQEKVKRAVCLQADFHNEYDELLNNPLSSYGINGVSMSWDSNKVQCSGGVYTTNNVYSLLRQTGLTYRGVML